MFLKIYAKQESIFFEWRLKKELLMSMNFVCQEVWVSLH